MGVPKTSAAQKRELDDILAGFSDVVTTELGRIGSVSYELDTGQASALQSGSYRIAPGLMEPLKGEIKGLLRAGIIVSSKSLWSSPMVPVKKKDGTIRLCIDFLQLNKVTVPDPYHMPRVDDLLDELAEAKWMSKLDLNNGLYQVPQGIDVQAKTAFCSPWGKYHFTCMPFGLRNAPAAFQRGMDEVLGEQGEWCSTYIDDVVVYSNAWEDHVIHVRNVLPALREAGLTAKPFKCVWGAKSLSYLGYTVGYGLVEVPEAKVKALQTFRHPVNKGHLSSFLGSVGYYRRFIPSFALKAGPLYDSLKKEAPHLLEWTIETRDAFSCIVNVLCSSSVLCLPREGDAMTLHTNASGRGRGAVLSTIRDGEESPIGYFSKRLSKAERNYAVTKLECLAVVKSIDHFTIHLLGKSFGVVSEHKALTARRTSTKLNGRLMRWALTLQDYDFEVIYRPGVKHQNADGLSRQAWPEDEENDPEPGVLLKEGEMSGSTDPTDDQQTDKSAEKLTT